jgi:hypothetical protein
LTDGLLKLPTTLKKTEYGSVFAALAFESRLDFVILPKNTRTFVLRLRVGLRRFAELVYVANMICATGFDQDIVHQERPPTLPVLATAWVRRGSTSAACTP